MTVKIIGVGNIFRRDDGAGLMAARILKTRKLMNVQIVEAAAEPAELITSWRGADHLIILDAAAPAGHPGRITRVVVGEDTLPAETPVSSTHAFGLTKAIELAEALNERPPSMIIFVIEGEDFDYGEGLSAPVEQALTVFVDQIADETSQLTRREKRHA